MALCLLGVEAGNLVTSVICHTCWMGFKYGESLGQWKSPEDSWNQCHPHNTGCCVILLKQTITLAQIGGYGGKWPATRSVYVTPVKTDSTITSRTLIITEPSPAWTISYWQDGSITSYSLLHAQIQPTARKRWKRNVSHPATWRQCCTNL